MIMECVGASHRFRTRHSCPTGCGDGYFAFEMAKQGEVKVDAVDNVDDLIKKAEQAKEKDNITNVIFYNQDYRTFKNENCLNQAAQMVSATTKRH